MQYIKILIVLENIGETGFLDHIVPAELWQIILTFFLYVKRLMSFVENCYTKLAIMLHYRKLFVCSAMIHYQMKVMMSFSGQFINIYNKPTDFYQMIRIFETVYYSNQQLHLLMFHDTDPDICHYH